jgi:oxygen-independent coproporphyrinogen-3 oxidase
MLTLATRDAVTSPIEPAPSPLGKTAGVYIHVPFCAHICPYCDFNTYAGQQELIPRYVAAVEQDIAQQGPAFASHRITSIFFGGGTPSLLPASSIDRLLRACRGAMSVDDAAEISLEANPNGLTEFYLADLRGAGVNRLSLGGQTLDRRGLRTLGRLHEAGDVLTALRTARSAGFDNLSPDLIFGWPGQTLESWRRDLDTVLDAAPDRAVDHLSLYSLIVEPGTPMADAVARGILHVADDDLGADLYEAAMERLDEAGFIHYEVANWARDTRFESRHNRVYWRNGEYAGIGAGAHGHLAGQRTMNHLLPVTYCGSIESGMGAVSNAETITPAMGMGETMMLGLRLLRDGVSDSAFAHRHGVSLNEVYGSLIDELATTGLIERRPDGVRLSRRGLLLANDVCARFLLDDVDAGP